MRVIILDTAEEATTRTVRFLVNCLASKPDAVLGLATGGTMERVYAGLVDAHRAGLRFAQAASFNLDEYVGLAPDHPHSYRSYMQRHLFDHVDIAPERTFVPLGNRDPVEAATLYEAHLSNLGPIDLQLLGLGRNGHIGFNEPGSSLASRVREKTLAESTRAANRQYFALEEDLPRSAITMGIGSIMDARQVVMLALGKAKAEAAKGVVEGPVTAICPGSALQFHRNVTVILDADAAGQLALKDHYRDAEALRVERESSHL
ncbi:MAG: glucosamine-6-phosphate deaminase [Pseudomonadota bacterium]